MTSSSSGFRPDSFSTFLRQMDLYDSEGSSTKASAEVVSDLLAILHVKARGYPQDDLQSDSGMTLLEFSRELAALTTKKLIRITGDASNRMCELTDSGRGLF